MGIDATDFTFTIGNDDSPEDWVAAPSPTDIGVFLGEGENGSDRVYVTFADGSITDTWLRITANANDDTGLAEDEDLFFGIAPGDTGANLPPNIIGVDAVDLASIAQNLTPLAEFGTEPITVSSDLNRDRTVDARDFLTVAANVDLNVINLITPQLGTAVASAVPEPSAFVLSGLAFLLSIPFLCRQRLTGP